MLLAELDLLLDELELEFLLLELELEPLLEEEELELLFPPVTAFATAFTAFDISHILVRNKK